MTTGMAWCLVSNMVIIKKQIYHWRGMVSLSHTVVPKGSFWLFRVSKIADTFGIAKITFNSKVM